MCVCVCLCVCVCVCVCASQSLTELSLGDNRISHLPAHTSHLTSLQKLFLYSNRLTSLPNQLLPSLISLTHCWLEGNPDLTGPNLTQILTDIAETDTRPDHPLETDLATAATVNSNGQTKQWQLLQPSGRVRGPERVSERGVRETVRGDSGDSCFRLRVIGLDTRQLVGVSESLWASVRHRVKVCVCVCVCVTNRCCS